MLKRVEIRAPIGGVVHQLAVHTIGGVINASEAAMLIVPENEALVLEARIPPQDIDQISIDRTTFVRFTTFNQRTTPELIGKISRIAADLTREPQTGLAYYVARITLPEDQLKRLGQDKLVPGMPAEVYIQTTERTALSYLMKPLSDQFARVGRER